MKSIPGSAFSAESLTYRVQASRHTSYETGHRHEPSSKPERTRQDRIESLGQGELRHNRGVVSPSSTPSVAIISISASPVMTPSLGICCICALAAGQALHRNSEPALPVALLPSFGLHSEEHQEIVFVGWRST